MPAPRRPDVFARSDPPPDLLTTRVEAVWLDLEGRITASNAAWDVFCVDNGGDLARCGVGASYLEVCEAAGDAVSRDVARSIRQVISGEIVEPTTHVLACPSPSLPRNFLLTVCPRADDSGSSVGALVVLQPTSAEHPTGDVPAGLESEGWQASVVDRSPDGVLLIDAGARIRYANDMAVKLTGHPRLDLVLSPLTMLLSPAARERHAALVEGYVRRPSVRMMAGARTLSLLRRDGSEVPVEIALAPTVVEGVTMTVATIRDVTEQRAEQRSRQQLLHILDLDPDAVWVVDATTGAVEYASQGVYQLLGWAPDQLQGVTVCDLTPHATLADLRRLVSEHLQAGLGYQRVITTERRTADGHVVPVDSRTQLVRIDDGRMKFLIVDRDARERRALERDQRQAAQLATLVADVHSLVISDAPVEVVYQKVVEGAAVLVDAENASLLLRDPVHRRMRTAAAVGPAATLHRLGAIELDQEVLASWHDNGRPRLVTGSATSTSEPLQGLVGSGLVVPFPGPTTCRGMIATFRARGREDFEEHELQVLENLSKQVATALELGRERTRRARMALVEDRQRIARDLHDHVIQDVIGVGMQLLAPDLASPTHDHDRDESLTRQLEDVVAQLRRIVFESENDDVSDGRPSELLARVVARSARILGFHPELAVRGGIEHVPPRVVHELVTVVREALSNVAKHAGAHEVSVLVTVTRTSVALRVDDDGVGPGQGMRPGNGLANMRARARSLGGGSSVTGRPGGGTRVRWRVPIERTRA